MSVEHRYRLVRAAMDMLPMVEMLAGPSCPQINWMAAMKAAQLVTPAPPR